MSVKKILKSQVGQAVLAWAGAQFIRLVFATSRKTYLYPSSILPYWQGHLPTIFVFWHGRMMVMPQICPPKRTMRVMISKHRDGRIISNIIGHLGIETISGSSSKGALVAVRETIDALNAGDNISITPDGPRGPFQVAADGAAHLSRLSQVPVIAASFSSSWHRRFKTWDKYMLALPFGHIVFTASEPMTSNGTQEMTHRIQQELTRLTEKADAIAGRKKHLLYRVYALATYMGLPLIATYMFIRKQRGKEHKSRGFERFGYASLARPQGKLVWLHAASVGEALALLPLIETLHREQPALHLLLTTGTVTSAALMEQRLPAGVIHQFVPIDLPQAMKRFYTHWQPDLGVLVESEIWPNLIMQAPCPLLLFNGRMSDGSLKGWQRMNGFAQSLFNQFALVAAQNDTEAARFRTLGSAHVVTAGNIKHAAASLPVNEEELEMLKTQLQGRPVLVAASTHPGEEEHFAALHAALKTQFPTLLTIIVPRHPDRGEAVFKALTQSQPSLEITLRSSTKLRLPDIHIADTLGELGLFYRLGTVVVMGGSFVPHGGQNPLEPARLGVPIICGPHMFNFTQIKNELLAERALIEVPNWPELKAIVISLLEDKAERNALAEAALRWSKEQHHVLDRYLTLLKPYLERYAHT